MRKEVPMEKFDIVGHKYAYLTLFVIFTFFMAIWHAMDKIPQKDSNIYENNNEKIMTEDTDNQEQYNREDDISYDEDEDRYRERRYKNHKSSDYDYEQQAREDEPQNNNDSSFQEENRRNDYQDESSEFNGSRADSDEYIRSTKSRRVGE